MPKKLNKVKFLIEVECDINNEDEVEYLILILQDQLENTKLNNIRFGFEKQEFKTAS